MKDRKLYIVGNGFDLWHGMPTSLWQFKGFVEGHDSDLLKAVQDYLPADENWSDLELALADIDLDSIVQDHEHLMMPYGAEDWSDSGHHDFQYEVSSVVETLSKELRSRLGEWIRQVPVPTPAMAEARLRSIDPASLFLTFNYTSTLEHLYFVPDSHILHIHGRAEFPDSELVLGHAWNPLDRPSLNKRPDIEDIDTRSMEANSILDRFFSATFKHSDRLLQEHRPFFERLTNLEEVCALGHSLSTVDELYFRSLLSIPGAASAQWQVACHSDGDFRALPARLSQLGVQADRTVPCSWSDI
jgi:hypothetical protein